MIEFFQEVAPDRLVELDKACAKSLREAEQCARNLAETFKAYQQVRKENPEEYRRLVEIEKLESEVRRLGAKVRELVEALKGGGGRGEVRTDTILALRAAKQELVAALEKGFVVSQQNQLIELNRLEAEVRELRQLLAGRGEQREAILAQRFRELTGEEPPKAEKRGLGNAAGLLSAEER